MGYEHRAYFRFKPKDTVAVLDPASGGHPCQVEDISCGGAFLHGHSLPPGTAQVEIRGHNTGPVVVECEAVRTGRNGAPWSAIRFTQPLLCMALERILHVNEGAHPGPEQPAELVKRDKEAIRKEISDIKSCRNTVFISAVGLLATATMAVWTAAIAHTIDVFAALPAFGVIFGVFVLGAVSTLEKVRAINLREGFLAALDAAICKAEVRERYCGWAHVKQCLAECGSWRRSKACQRGIEPRGQASCRDVGKARAQALRSGKRMLPGMLDSFTSLTSGAYGILYILLVLLCCFYLGQAWQEAYHILPIKTYAWFAAGFPLCVVLRRTKRWLDAIPLVVALALLAGCVVPFQVLVYASSVCLGVIFGAVGRFLVRQYADVRAGRFSFETYLCTWNIVMQEGGWQDPKADYRPTGWREKLTRWVLRHVFMFRYDA